LRKNRLPVLAFVALAASALALVAGLAGSGDAATDQGRVVGLVSDVGRFNDRSFNQSALEGCRRAQRTLGMTCRPFESRSTSDYVPNLANSAQRERAAVTIAVGFLLAEATNDVANRYPNSRFGIIDYSVATPPFTRNRNVTGLTFDTNENSYMIGCLAALMARRAGSNVISAVGGIRLPSVTIFIAGYRAGARRCNRRAVVLFDFSQSFTDQSRCKEIALNQIARGSRVVFQVAGDCGLGALDAARERGRWGIGVDKDQKFLGRHILTSAVKRVDQAVYLTAQRARAGTLRGGSDQRFNLRNGGVAVGRIDRRVPRTFIRRMNALRPLIIRGRIRPPKTL
jgi:basic membrane protein A and related proteins